MKKTLSLTLLCLIKMNCMATEIEDNKFYLKISGGPSLPSEVEGDFSKASITKLAVYGVALGYEFNKQLSADLSFDYRGSYKNNFNEMEEELLYNYTTKVKSLSLMTNLYYNFNSFHNFIPYITVGGGITRNTTNNSKIIISDESFSSNNSLSGATSNNFIYKAGLGIKYRVGNNLDIGLQYQFVDLGKFKTGNKITAETGASDTSSEYIKAGRIKSNEFLLNASYKF